MGQIQSQLKTSHIQSEPAYRQASISYIRQSQLVELISQILGFPKGPVLSSVHQDIFWDQQSSLIRLG